MTFIILDCYICVVHFCCVSLSMFWKNYFSVHHNYIIIILLATFLFFLVRVKSQI